MKRVINYYSTLLQKRAPLGGSSLAINSAIKDEYSDKPEQRIAMLEKELESVNIHSLHFFFSFLYVFSFLFFLFLLVFAEFSS